MKEGMTGGMKEGRKDLLAHSRESQESYEVMDLSLLYLRVLQEASLAIKYGVYWSIPARKLDVTNHSVRFSLDQKDFMLSLFRHQLYGRNFLLRTLNSQDFPELLNAALPRLPQAAFISRIFSFLRLNF